MNVPYAPSLLAEARRPSGVGALDAPCTHGRAADPACGDEVELDLRATSGRVTHIAHRTRGCMFAVASASLIARTVPGHTVDDALALIAALERDLPATAALRPELAPLAGLQVYPVRIRCALLPWQALRAALREIE